jgi:Tol biopolymer transport system component
MSDIQARDRFEAELPSLLVAYAETGIRPIDARAVATMSMTSTQPRLVSMPDFHLSIAARLLLVAAIVVALVIALIGVAGLRPRPVPLIVYSWSQQLFAVDPAGGVPSALGPGARALWSPDHHAIAFVLDDELWSMSAGGSNRRALGPVGRWFAWSPTGGQLVADTPSGLEILSSDGSSSTNLDLKPFKDSGPGAWSPDGSAIAVVVTQGDSLFRLIVVSATESGAERPIAADLGADRFMPAWSPDGAWIAASSSTSLGVMRLDGSSRRELLASSGDMWRMPAWSPDGRFIATSRYAPTAGTFGRAVVVDVATGSITATLWPPDGRSATVIDWSADGRSVLLDVVKGAGASEVWMVSADGTTSRRVVEWVDHALDESLGVDW